MILLILGLIVFLGPHSLRIFADSWRSAQIARIGEGPWKGLYSLISIAGFVLLIWGYGRARGATTVLWQPPSWTHYVAAPGSACRNGVSPGDGGPRRDRRCDRPRGLGDICLLFARALDRCAAARLIR